MNGASQVREQNGSVTMYRREPWLGGLLSIAAICYTTMINTAGAEVSNGRDMATRSRNFNGAPQGFGEETAHDLQGEWQLAPRVTDEDVELLREISRDRLGSLIEGKQTTKEIANAIIEWLWLPDETGGIKNPLRQGGESAEDVGADVGDARGCLRGSEPRFRRVASLGRGSCAGVSSGLVVSQGRPAFLHRVLGCAVGAVGAVGFFGQSGVAVGHAAGAAGIGGVEFAGDAYRVRRFECAGCLQYRALGGLHSGDRACGWDVSGAHGGAGRVAHGESLCVESRSLALH